MNHNKFDLKEGETVVLDATFANHSEVIIKSFTSNKMFAEIFGLTDTPKDSWEVMTNRLSPLISKIT